MKFANFFIVELNKIFTSIIKLWFLKLLLFLNFLHLFL